MSSKIMLILPPSTKESDFDVNESSSVIFLQLIKDSVKNVLDTGLLNVIPSWWKNTHKIHLQMAKTNIALTASFPEQPG